MKLRFKTNGTVIGVYSETIDCKELGVPEIHRASHVEPDPNGHWTADLSPVNGPVLGPFARRSEALKAEMDYLEEHL